MAIGRTGIEAARTDTSGDAIRVESTDSPRRPPGPTDDETSTTDAENAASAVLLGRNLGLDGDRSTNTGKQRVDPRLCGQLPITAATVSGDYAEFYNVMVATIPLAVTSGYNSLLD